MSHFTRKFPYSTVHFRGFSPADTGDEGYIVGMILYRREIGLSWEYNLDLTVESPNYWEMQGINISNGWESPADTYYKESNLVLIDG
ncbi:MAG: hypothetical protein F6K40_38785 [Okeania sp. SIO3I5]|uniref:hypothetical protein n=1 Tax=Okeania sp. SIO3I5 TaxID=2607805 RepID=UPI0013B61A9E|nr:hypothetical protein [Okeania sp. SIO3I5]NEQ41810.1 hypothetical protein [Okeania sp. SIO3I5]